MQNFNVNLANKYGNAFFAPLWNRIDLERFLTGRPIDSENYDISRFQRKIAVRYLDYNI
jgi:hypothetical protein